MWSFLLLLAPLSLASSITGRGQACPESKTTNVQAFGPHSVSFLFTCESCAEASSLDEESADVVLTLDLSPCASVDTQCLEAIINGQRLISNTSTHSPTDISNIISVNDVAGVVHEIELYSTLWSEPTKAIDGHLPVDHERIVLEIQAFDGRKANETVEIDWTRSRDSTARIEALQLSFNGEPPTDSTCFEVGTGSSQQDIAKISQTIMQDASFIQDEIEALKLLEEQAARLQAEIGTRRTAIAFAQATYNTQTPLDQVIHECEGILCAARAIINRIGDKVTLATTSQVTYSQLPDSGADDAPPPYTPLAHIVQAGQQNATNNRDPFTGNFTGSGDFLLKALTYIASLLGLIAICSFIKRKCMSMRKRVERAADREERRNARAYRRAARRADMKRRWSSFLRTISCFGARHEPARMTDYDEKRALILQDALLEQDFDQAEKGQVMEAQIRELRNAHEIVSSILRQREPKPENMPQKDPPPPLVPLPETRSRSSTGTLPSYDSASLPDYSSLPEPTGEYNTTTDGFARYIPSSTSENTWHQPPSSNGIGTRSTPISSVAGLSPRVSAETLRTRFSKTTDQS